MAEAKKTATPTPVEKPAPVTSSLLGAAIGGATGMIFGTALEKSKVALPVVIRSQMLFTDLKMLKVFLSATIMGLVVFRFLERAIGHTRKPKPPVALGLGLLGGYGGNIVGGACLGIGMTISGACPGTVFAQVGMGVENSIFTLMGGFVGASLYGLLNPILKRATAHRNVPHHSRKEAKTLGNLFGGQATAAFIWAGLLATMVGIAEYLHPSLHFLPTGESIPLTNLSLTAERWSPFTSGLLIGALQLPSFYFIRSVIGTSSTFCTLAGGCSTSVNAFLPFDVNKHTGYFTEFLSGVGNFWNLAFVIGSIAGGYLSSSASGVVNNLASGTPLQSFIGGVMILFGARLADGCTSGHGITGMATMALSSIASVASMFAGGIATAFLMYGQ